MGIRSWYLFSSSSGQTLKALWGQLDSAERSACRGILIDRQCPAIEVARSLPEAPAVHVFERPAFEEEALKFARLQSEGDDLVLLCGFFGILSADFLQKFPGVFVNTHPSLLPAFPGLDKRVHRDAAKSVCVSGFSIHLVTEELDGGTILFQQPVWVDTEGESGEQLREDVRVAEQALLPKIWKQLLQSDLSKEDLTQNSFDLRKRLGLNKAFFVQQLGRDLHG